MSIKEIARLAGVSTATVSRIMNDPEHKCANKDTRRRVLEAARKLHYTPNQSARNLKTGQDANAEIRHVNILVTRNMADPFFSELVELIEVQSHNNRFIISNIWCDQLYSNDDRCRTENIAGSVRKMFQEDTLHAEGMIILGKCNRKVLEIIKQYCRHIVAINRNAVNYGVDEAVCNGQSVAGIAVRHLIQLGHKKIGYVGVCHDEERFLGFQKTLFEYNITPEMDYIYNTAAGYMEGCEAIEYFLKLADPPTALYCANDIIAIGILDYLNKHKNRYYNPSIISSDDIYEAQYTKPILTTVRLPKEEMVKFAFMILDDKMQGGHESVIRMDFEGKLIVRESTFKPESTFDCEYYI